MNNPVTQSSSLPHLTLDETETATRQMIDLCHSMHDSPNLASLQERIGSVCATLQEYSQRLSKGVQDNPLAPETQESDTITSGVKSTEQSTSASQHGLSEQPVANTSTVSTDASIDPGSVTEEAASVLKESQIQDSTKKVYDFDPIKFLAAVAFLFCFMQMCFRHFPISPPSTMPGQVTKDDNLSNRKLVIETALLHCTLDVTGTKVNLHVLTMDDDFRRWLAETPSGFHHDGIRVDSQAVVELRPDVVWLLGKNPHRQTDHAYFANAAEARQMAEKYYAAIGATLAAYQMVKSSVQTLAKCDCVNQTYFAPTPQVTIHGIYGKLKVAGMTRFFLERYNDKYAFKSVDALSWVRDNAYYLSFHDGKPSLQSHLLECEQFDITPRAKGGFVVTDCHGKRLLNEFAEAEALWRTGDATDDTSAIYFVHE